MLIRFVDKIDFLILFLSYGPAWLSNELAGISEGIS